MLTYDELLDLAVALEQRVAELEAQNADLCDQLDEFVDLLGEDRFEFCALTDEGLASIQ